MSDAVTVPLPAVPSATLNVWLPATSAALAGNVAAPSLDVIPTTSATLVTEFQLASTACTVMMKPDPAICVDGVPVFPLGEPGTVDSPGTIT